MIKLYNTLTRHKDKFEPLEGNSVKIYTCGLTVYSHPQIGNWVAYIYSDVLTRTLLESGYSIKRIQNITDVGHLVSDDDVGEDKMEKGARAEGLDAWKVAEKYSKIAKLEAQALNLLPPDKLVRATDLVKEQIKFVKVLESKGYTYEIEDGIYFDTSKLADYGKLARLDIEGLQAGVRVDVGGKKNITDFALWKFSPKNQKRDMEWDSPWGVGFPGWHLECSVIARENLGDQIDIHTGGIDHIPVHHTNEIAQTEAVTGKKFSNFWFHNNHMKIDGAKLSKSLGNSYTLEDIISRGFSLMAFKLLVLSSHYRTEGNFSWDILEAADNRLSGYYQMADLKWQTIDQEKQAYNGEQVFEALCDDINTPKALALVSEQANVLDSQLVSKKSTKQFQAYLELVDRLLGLDISNRPDITKLQKSKIVERQKARDNKDWALSDEIRNHLSSQGIGVRDTPNGQIWFRI